MSNSSSMGELEKLLPKCPTKDTDDFRGPEKLKEEERCYNCRLWDAIDAKIKEVELAGRIDEVRLIPFLQDGKLLVEWKEKRLAELRTPQDTTGQEPKLRACLKDDMGDSI